MKGNKTFFGFSFRRFMQNIIRKKDFASYKNSKQYWKITWLVYKSYMFRPENLIFIGSQIALCSTVAPMISLNKNEEIIPKLKTDEKLLREKIKEAVDEQTYQEVVDLLEADEYMDELEAAKEVANENQQVYEEALGTGIMNDTSNHINADNEYGSLNVDNYTGFETEVDVNHAKDLFDHYKQELSQIYLENGVLKTEPEIENFKNNIANLRYKRRMLMDQETLVGQGLVYRIQDFFYGFSQKSKHKDPVQEALDNYSYLTSEYRKYRLYFSHRFKIYDPEDFKLRRIINKMEETQTQKMDVRDSELFGNLFTEEKEQHVDEAELTSQRVNNASTFIRKILYKQKTFLNNLEEQRNRSDEVELKFDNIKGYLPSHYQEIMSYLHNLKGTGMKHSDELVRIYDMIPSTERDLRIGFTQFLIQTVYFFKHLLNPDKKNDFLINEESLFLKMLENLNGESYVFSKYSSLIGMIRKLSHPVNSKRPRGVNKKKIIKRYKNRLTVEGARFKEMDSKKDDLKKYKINVTWNFFCELLKASLQTNQIGDALNLLDSIPKGYDVTKRKHIDLGDYVVNTPAHHISIQRLQDNYDEWSKILLERVDEFKTTDNVIKKKMYEDSIFRGALDHFQLTKIKSS